MNEKKIMIHDLEVYPVPHRIAENFIMADDDTFDLDLMAEFFEKINPKKKKMNLQCFYISNGACSLVKEGMSLDWHQQFYRAARELIHSGDQEFSNVFYCVVIALKKPRQWSVIQGATQEKANTHSTPLKN